MQAPLTHGVSGFSPLPLQGGLGFHGGPSTVTTTAAFSPGTEKAVLDATERVGAAGARVAEAHPARRLVRRHGVPVNGAVRQFHGRPQGTYDIGVAVDISTGVMAWQRGCFVCQHV